MTARAIRYFSEACSDGFPTDVPDWLAFCPRCGARLSAEEHRLCAHYRGGEGNTGEVVTAFRCAYEGKDTTREDRFVDVWDAMDA